VDYSLKIWVEEYGGISKLAKRLKITDHAVRAWLRGESTPCLKNLIVIVKLSEGKLKLDQVIRETNNKMTRV